MSAPHTPEPWDVNLRAGPPREVFAGDILICDTGVGEDNTCGEDTANARRIVSCVNACAGLSDPEAAIPALVAALQAADVFIRNGIALGYIRMPDADCPDPAKLTPELVRAALALVPETPK